MTPKEVLGTAAQPLCDCCERERPNLKEIRVTDEYGEHVYFACPTCAATDIEERPA